MKIELEYVKVGDYYFPAPALEPQPDRSLGKYGLMRLRYLKEHRLGLFNRLTLSGKLYAHLLETEDAANDLLDSMMPDYDQRQGIRERLKTENQMEWVGRMNNCKAQAEEVIMAKLIMI